MPDTPPDARPRREALHVSIARECRAYLARPTDSGVEFAQHILALLAALAPGDAPRTHDLKVWPEFFDALLTGVKTFEARKDDRGFQVGDVLRLREFKHRVTADDGYTGRETTRCVTYILRGPDFGIVDGHVVLALASGDAPTTPQGDDQPCSQGCMLCSGERCAFHGSDPCECDVIERHQDADDRAREQERRDAPPTPEIVCVCGDTFTTVRAMYEHCLIAHFEDVSLPPVPEAPPLPPAPSEGGTER